MRWTNVLRLINYFEFCLFSPLWVVRCRWQWRVFVGTFGREANMNTKHCHCIVCIDYNSRILFRWMALTGMKKKGQTGRHVTVFLSIFFSQIDKSQTNVKSATQLRKDQMYRLRRLAKRTTTIRWETRKRRRGKWLIGHGTIESYGTDSRRQFVVVLSLAIKNEHLDAALERTTVESWRHTHVRHWQHTLHMY